MAFGVKSIIKAAAFAGINEFLGFGKKSGYARPNRFEIMIIPPSGVRGSGSSGGVINPDVANLASKTQDLRTTIFNCESFSIPGKNLVSAPDTNLYGPEREVVTGETFGDITSTFYCSSDLKEKKFFNAWQGVAAAGETSFSLGYYNDYVGKIEIFQLDENDNRTYGCVLHDCFPKTVTDLSVNQAVATDIQKITVTWTYRYWTSNDDKASSSTLGTRIVDAIKNTVTRKITSQIPSVLRRL